MSLFVLREGYRVVTTPSGGSVVHSRTGDELPLTHEEVQLLARATAGGVDASEPQLRPLVRKFANLGILKESALPSSAPASSVGPVAPASKLPQGEDVVPLFRPDLKIARRASSSLFDVSNPTSAKTFPLYDFELSLARMLDGQRTYAQAVESGQHLGIPVSLDSLGQFIRQLEAYGFLAPAGTKVAEAAKGSTWAPRKKWDDGLRALFQSGLKMHRQGRYTEAASYFEAMIEQDPQNPEALEMLEQARQRLAGGGAVPLPSGADSAQVGIDQLVPDFSLPGMNASDSAAPAKPGAHRRFRARPLVIALGAVAVAAVAATWWLGRDVPPGPAVPVAAPVRKNAGESANATRPDVSSAADLAVADAGVVDAGSVVVQTSPPSADAGEPEPSANAVDAALATADTDQDALLVKVTKRGRVKKGEVRAPVDGAVSWKATLEQRVQRGEIVGSLTTKSSAERALTAPKDGLFVPKVDAQAKAKKGRVLAAVVYYEAFMQALVRGAQPLPSWSCEVLDEGLGQKASCKVVSVSRRGQNFLVTATAQPLWIDNAANPQLRLSPP
ncbi:MAG: tetratricopeptide repeat protein [Myxococcota bacterium]